MEPRVSLITLGVADLARSFRFYRDGLGLPTTRKPEDGIVFFKTSGVTLALYPYAKLAADAGPGWDAPRSKFTGITLAHYPDAAVMPNSGLGGGVSAGRGGGLAA
jgi:catechol 2,3-dioxygenase-like lactoylglutathione lyase family enzyme